MSARTILVVDDDEAIRDCLATVLRDGGLSVEAVKDGQQAIAWLHAHPGVAMLVLLDLMMPVMDGRAFLRAKEAEPELADLPVVVITAGGECEQVLRTHSVRQCLTKPLSLHQLLQSVRALTA